MLRLRRPLFPRVGVAAVLLLTMVVAPVLALGDRAEARDGLTRADQELADTFRPVVMLRRYDELCADTGEPYVPTTVDTVLGNPSVALRQVGQRGGGRSAGRPRRRTSTDSAPAPTSTSPATP